MLRSILVSSVVVVALLAVNVQATPLSVRIDDHDFSFDVPYFPQQPLGWGAVYNFDGVNPDRLGIQSSVPNHYVGSYSYVGKLPTVPGLPSNLNGNPPIPSPFIYPVAQSSTFGGDLELEMFFDRNDGPYIDSKTGDRFDISLVGDMGHLIITGQIYSQGFAPLYPDPSLIPPPPKQDIVLLDIEFEQVTLLARVNEDSIFMIEGYGRINTLLGYAPAQEPGLPDEGVTFFKFFSEMPQGPIFTDPNYQPTDDYQYEIMGHISGEAGAGVSTVPEPVTMVLLGLGGIGVLLRRRRI